MTSQLFRIFRAAGCTTFHAAVGIRWVRAYGITDGAIVAAIAAGLKDWPIGRVNAWCRQHEHDEVIAKRQTRQVRLLAA